MAKDKKSLDDDLLTGGKTLSDSNSDKSAKKAEKAAAKAKKNAEKNAAKKLQLQKKLDAAKEELAEQTDDGKKAKLEAEIKKLQSKISAVGSKKAAASMAKRTQKIVKTTVAVVIVVALLVTYVATGTVRKGFISYLGLPAQYFTGMTVSNGENKQSIKVSTYNYYFATTYNQLQSQQSQYSQYGLNASDYGMDVDFDKALSKQTTKDDDDKEITWLEKIQGQVKDNIESTYTYYLAAVADNDGKEPDITQEQQKDIDDAVDSYRESAHKYGYTVSGYLVKAMGKGVTEHVFRKEAKISYIADNYKNELSEKMSSTEYSEEQYNTYKSEHNDDLLSVSAKIFECDTEDDAKAFTKALKADGSNFASLAAKYSTDDFYKTAYKQDGYSAQLHVTKKTLKNQGLAVATADKDDANKFPGLDWLYSTERKAGEKSHYSTTAIYILEPVSISEVKTVNVRHILVSPITDEKDDTDPKEATQEQWDAALKSAEDILKEYKSGEKTADAFGELAKTHSTDTGSSAKGGLYENVVPGQMVNSFSYWSFDSKRKTGDTAIVKSDYGYHIMYFAGTNDMPAWKYTAQQELASADTTTATEKLEKEYTIKVNWLGSRYFEIDTDIDA